MPPSDRQLIQRFRAGDPAAFEALFTRYAERVHRFGFRLCGDRADAEDVLQDTFLAAFRGLGRFEGRAQLSTWLYRIAASACFKRRRRRKGEPRRSLSLEALLPRRDFADRSGQPERMLERKQLNAAVKRAVGALPPPYRAALVLRDMEGLSAEDTATALGLTVAAVKSRLHRARLAVRKALDDTFRHH